MLKLTSFIIILAIGVSYYLGAFDNSNASVPRLAERFWGPLNKKNHDVTIRPYKIDISESVIQDLKERLNKTRKYVEPLENAAWTYGFSSKYFENVIDYWKIKYDWSKRQTLLNKYPQFITTIQGLDIHFYHVKPSTVTTQNGKKLKVLPLLLSHGWPGSVVEFQKIIPMLTTPQLNADFIFEVIIPSLPGYGFSQGAVRPGLDHIEIAIIFKNLMTRLGFEKFYAQGGDWGSIITQDLALLFPERVLGAHMNMCHVSSIKATMWQLIGTIFPSLVVTKEHWSKMYPLKDYFMQLITESGYMHLQATKPDTIGTALMDSPASLAVYILEKFSSWTNMEYRLRDDGGLVEKYTMDELLDNIMIYWISNSITTSMRLYAESFNANNFGKLDKYQTTVPTACAVFPHELVYTPESIAKIKHRNLIQFNHMLRGGHFAAFEEPKLLADDVWKFVNLVEKTLAQSNN